jgi:hypothetical protein
MLSCPTAPPLSGQTLDYTARLIVAVSGGKSVRPDASSTLAGWFGACWAKLPDTIDVASLQTPVLLRFGTILVIARACVFEQVKMFCGQCRGCPRGRARRNPRARKYRAAALGFADSVAGQVRPGWPVSWVVGHGRCGMHPAQDGPRGEVPAGWRVLFRAAFLRTTLAPFNARGSLVTYAVLWAGCRG